MEWALLYGHFDAHLDPIGVGPQSGGLLGILYDWHAGGPVYLTSEFTRIASQRLVIDPTVPAAKRDLGTAYWPLYALESGLELSFPGDRTGAIRRNAQGWTGADRSPFAGRRGRRTGTRFDSLRGATRCAGFLTNMLLVGACDSTSTTVSILERRRIAPPRE